MRHRFACLLLLPLSAWAGPAEDQLLACMRANIPPTLSIREFELKSFDRAGGERLLKGRLYAKRENDKLRATLRLTAPADMNGAAYLMKEGSKQDEMYVFLPALNRVRRIQGAAGDGPLFGTDLSYADIKQINSAFAGAAPALEGREKLEGRDASVLTVKPHAENGSRTTRIRAVVDQTTCVALRVEFFEGSSLRKRLTSPAASLTKAGNYWYAASAEMHDLKTATKTRLNITGVKSGEELANRYFDSRNFHLGN